jgi:hypothetical protein
MCLLRSGLYLCRRLTDWKSVTAEPSYQQHIQSLKVYPGHTMRLYISVLFISLTLLQGSQAQFNMFNMGDMGRFFGGFQRGAANFFKPMQAMFGGFGAARNPNSAANSFGIVGGTDAPQATGRDDLLPADCGRDKKTNKGSLCFPDGLLCEDRKNQFHIRKYLL